jgi:hypothetical protein
LYDTEAVSVVLLSSGGLSTDRDRLVRALPDLLC